VRKEAPTSGVHDAAGMTAASKGTDRRVTAADLLHEARCLGVARLDATALAAHHTGATRAWLVAHDDEPLPSDRVERVRRDLARRAAGEPLAYLVGRREFHGLEFEVTPHVLIPRPETEVLVDWALETMPASADASREAAIVVDLGTGSGAIALAIAHACVHARVHAVDTSAAALEVARRNAQRLGLDVAFHVGDWWSAEGLRATNARVTLAVSNPPYVREGDPHLAALAHEPSLALVAGNDGLDAIRAIVHDAPAHLAPGGRLLIEHGFDQGAAVRELFHRHAFGAVETRRDLAGHERCTGGVRA
jgi:release factor glutamine methyltransferase